MDFLKEWVAAMKEFRFKNDITHTIFDLALIDRIDFNIRKFFPENAYSSSAQSRILDQGNWLLDFLLIKKPSLIGYAFDGCISNCRQTVVV